MAEVEKQVARACSLYSRKNAAVPFRDVLTERERQVLQGLCESLSNKEIARHLDISEPTVKVHAQAVFRKIGARNRTHAAIIARENGFM